MGFLIQASRDSYGRDSYGRDFDFLNHALSFRGHERLYWLQSSCPSSGRILKSLWVPLDRGFRDGTTSFSRDGVRLTSHLLLIELVGWVKSPRQ